MSNKLQKNAAFISKLIVAKVAIVTISSIIIFVGLDKSSTSTAIAQSMASCGYPFGGHITQFRFGTIGSIQNGEDGKPQWILSGVWNTNLLNQSSNVVNSSNSVFDISFGMIMLNGSAMHTHFITDYVLQNKSMSNKAVQVFTGTSTMSMKEGPISNVPTIIKIMNNKVISIWLDQSKLKNHFGNTPIYGIVLEPRFGARVGPSPHRINLY
jgi:hypothetical protein